MAIWNIKILNCLHGHIKMTVQTFAKNELVYFIALWLPKCLPLYLVNYLQLLWSYEPNEIPSVDHLLLFMHFIWTFQKQCYESIHYLEITNLTKIGTKGTYHVGNP